MTSNPAPSSAAARTCRPGRLDPVVVGDEDARHEWQCSPSVGGTSSAGLRSKKPNGIKREAGVLDRHDRPVLGPHEVRDAERVPDDEVGVGERAVARGPARQAVVARVLVRVLARGPPLVAARTA